MIVLIIFGIALIAFAYFQSTPSDGIGGTSVLANWTTVIITAVIVVAIIGFEFWRKRGRK